MLSQIRCIPFQRRSPTVPLQPLSDRCSLLGTSIYPLLSTLHPPFLLNYPIHPHHHAKAISSLLPEPLPPTRPPSLLLLREILPQFLQSPISMTNLILGFSIHLGIRLTSTFPRLEYRVPTEMRWTSCRDNLAFCSAFKEDRILAWAGGIGERT